LYPVLSPDGSALAFTSRRAGAFDLYLKKVGESDAKRLVATDGWINPTDWTSDGRYIIYSERTAASGSDIWILPTAPGSTPRPFLRTPFYEYGGTVSPNGRWMAYTSDRSGRYEVYVSSFSGGDSAYRISTGGAIAPTWSADGRELFFTTLANEVASVRVTKAGASFEATLPDVLFRIPGLPPEQLTPNAMYAVASGDRFLLVTIPDGSPKQSITVTLNRQSN
jgi:Tol biopolymer transport system component